MMEMMLKHSFKCCGCLLPSDSTRRNQTPLHWSSEKGHLRICELLLQNGAHVNAKNNG